VIQWGMRVALPEIRTSVFVGAFLSALGLSACTSTGNDPAAALAMTSTVDLALPDTVAVVPASYAADPDALAAAALAPATDPKALDTAEAVPAVAEVAPSAAAAVEITPNAFAKADTPHGELDGLIAKYAAVYEVPVDLVRRVVKRESNFNPAAYHRGYWGLMQIKHATARGMGYDGPAKGLLDAETNLKYAVKYLRGAWLVAGGNREEAVRLYANGYYFDAKRMGLLDETGLGTDRRRRMPSSI
jgi:soluble lytic murein transglycosylase-like protein